MATIQERAATFLAQGLKPGQVASIIGVTPSRIAQLAQEPQWPEIYAKACELYGTAPAERAAMELLNSKYSALEAKIIDTIDSTVAMMEPRDQIKALDVVATRQEKMQARINAARAPQGGAQQSLVVQINIPAHALPEYQINEKAEIISIGQQSMAPLSAEGVKQMFAKHKATLATTSPQVETPAPTSHDLLEDF